MNANVLRRRGGRLEFDLSRRCCQGSPTRLKHPCLSSRIKRQPLPRANPPAPGRAGSHPHRVNRPPVTTDSSQKPLWARRIKNVGNPNKTGQAVKSTQERKGRQTGKALRVAASSRAVGKAPLGPNRRVDPRRKRQLHSAAARCRDPELQTASAGLGQRPGL